MRVAFLSPWFATLAVIHAEGLRRLGHQTLVITTDGHFAAPSHEGLVMPAALKHRSTPRAFLAASMKLRRFAPDVVLLDETWDPRFHLLAAGRRKATFVHDATPHDPESRPTWSAALLTRAREDSDAKIAFSDHVAALLRRSTSAPCHVVPLASEMPESLAPAPVKAEHRRDFVVLGRGGGYKGVDFALEVWERYTRLPSYRGDRLVLLGGASRTSPLESVTVEPGRYSWERAAEVVSRAKATLCLYRTASQSGVQVLSFQCGTVPVVTEVGALGEYQDGLLPPAPYGDVEEAAQRLAAVTDPVVAAAIGRRARDLYDSRYAPGVVSERLDRIIRAHAAAT
jgi:glycosyltransferase involved in cell wall biosynthesis